MPDPVEPTTPPGLPAWGFAVPGPLRDRLTTLVLDGTKIRLTDSTLVVCRWFRVVELLEGPA